MLRKRGRKNENIDSKRNINLPFSNMEGNLQKFEDQLIAGRINCTVYANGAKMLTKYTSETKHLLL